MEFHSEVYTDGKGPTYGYSPEGCLSRRSWARGKTTDCTYDAWGNVLTEECTVPALATIRYRFQGREWSAATGLVHFRMRWYDPETGRWLSKDPIRLSGGLNLYAFCFCDPLNFVDPIGLCDSSKSELPPFWKKGGGPAWHHRGRNSRNADLPMSPPSEDSGWMKLPPSQSIYHDNKQGKPENKYINPDGREAVYDGDTDNLITDNNLKGTYNYVNPPAVGQYWITWPYRAVGHFFADMVPYYLWGN